MDEILKLENEIKSLYIMLDNVQTSRSASNIYGKIEELRLKIGILKTQQNTTD